MKKKPSIILDYNKTKGGVDTVDKKIASYTCRRKTNRWPVVVFTNILDISVINAFVLFNSVCPEWNNKKHHRRRLFIQSLGEALIKPHMKKRVHLPRSTGARNIITNLCSSNAELSNTPGSSTEVTGAQKRGRCGSCQNSYNRHTSKCTICKKFICKAHTRNVCYQCMK